MINENLYTRLCDAFRAHYGRPHTAAAYAPGRLEALGNHTDYNEGFALSAAINLGAFFLAAPSENAACRLVECDSMASVSFDDPAPRPFMDPSWGNYVKGVFAGLVQHKKMRGGFLGMFLGNIPLGAGLSSSAALELSAALALCDLAGMDMDKLELARIAQTAEHEYAGVNCGLLDQISSLFGRKDHLVMTDFRSLDIQTVPLGKEARFLMCNTHVKHSLVESEYNERREACLAASRHFASVLDHPVSALRDVSWEEWKAQAPLMEPVAARRAAHVIGENSRVLAAVKQLADNNLEALGKLMFESHESSRSNFENSCPELDWLVKTASALPGVIGARLSGGGFGGSAVILTRPRHAKAIQTSLAAAYQSAFQHPCDICVITPSDGARSIPC